MEIIEIYTDGSCKGNPGPGGWAAVFLEPEAKRPFAILHGNTKHTTNNRMEMMAVIEALRYLKNNDLHEKKIVLHSDSNLVVQTINQGWKRKKNKDLWEQFDTFNNGVNITYQWIKAHAGDRWNSEADNLAFGEATKAEKKLQKEEPDTEEDVDTSIPKDQQGLF